MINGDGGGSSVGMKLASQLTGYQQLEQRSNIIDMRSALVPSSLWLPADAEPGTVQPVALIMHPPFDTEADVLSRMLPRAGIPVLNIAHSDICVFEISFDPTSSIISYGKWKLRPAVSLVRHLTPNSSYGLGERPHERFALLERAALVSALAALAPIRLDGPRLPILAQLKVLDRAGIETPPTMVITPGELGNRVPGWDSVVVKAMSDHFLAESDGNGLAALPSLLTKTMLTEQLPSAPGPLLVQAYVPHEAEYRIYFIDDDIHCFWVQKSDPGDLWRNPASVDVVLCEPDVDLSAAVRCAAGALGIKYAAFDVLATESGYVFLEANMDGDWSWFEMKAKSGRISVSMLRALRRSFVRVSGNLSPKQKVVKYAA